MTIENKVQVVAGGTSGMGLALAEALGAFGPVLVGGRNEKRLADAVAQLEAAGVKAYGKTCDVADMDSVQAFADYAQTLGTIGGVVNAAGVDYDTATIEQLITINMKGTINMVEAFKDLIDEGVMVNFSSITGYFYPPTPEDIAVWNDPNAADFVEKATAAIVRPAGTPDFLDERYPYYAATKRFVMHYSQANATRFGAKGNRIFSIAPGSFDTPMLRAGATPVEGIIARTAFKRLGTPEEMADLIIVLMQPGHDYLTGADIVMDGGKMAMSTVPQLV